MSIQLDAQTAHGRLRRALATLREAECSAVTLFAEIMRRPGGFRIALSGDRPSMRDLLGQRGRAGAADAERGGESTGGV